MKNIIFSYRIHSELEDIQAKNREARIKHNLLHKNPLTPYKPKPKKEPSTVFFSAKSEFSTPYFTPRNN